MKLISIFIMLAFVGFYSFKEIPKMLRGSMYKELVIFAVFMLIGLVSGIFICFDIPVYNPSDSLTILLTPLVELTKKILG
ncbi:hypothetical protein [Clostridium merdae]|uniref:hypothetical protein n=1 Tax=Clostridium merdae TaxID=1958780 RepID=UPI000A268EAD|nr:hypothetical protein [Clostridium merdae]